MWLLAALKALIASSVTFAFQLEVLPSEGLRCIEPVVAAVYHQQRGDGGEED